MDYPEFLETKQIIHPSTGIDPKSLHKNLFPFQKKVVQWAIRKGRCAIFADTGLGKTAMQVEWGKHYAKHTGKQVLIVAPLSVARQTIREAKNILGYTITYSRGEKVKGDLVITNYEMLKNFKQEDYGGIIFDESSIFKAIDGKTYRFVIDYFGLIPYRLCCTATPAPNDLPELGNHCEVLGIMTAAEMRATFFYNTGDTSDKWEMRRYGEEKFYRWLASWSMSIKLPSDIGFDDDGYVLPPLNIIPIFLETDWKPDGMLFNDGTLRGLTQRNEVRKDTVELRANEVLRLVKKHKGEQIIIWNWLNSEADLIKKMIGEDCVNVQGSDSPEVKAQAFEDFQDGKFSDLDSKADICGFGMNFQNAHVQIFNGMTDSFEQVYQCIRRSYRFGQKHPVTIYAVMADAQKPIWENILRKQAQADEMSAALIEHVKDFEKEELEGKRNGRYKYIMKTEQGKTWTAYLGDSCERMKEISDNSIHLSVFSPPFQDLFTYTATERDLGNSKTKQEFFGHFKYIIRELLRITMPGRNVCCHVADIPLQKARVGYMGMDDFPGDTIRAFQAEGFIWYGRHFIQKNPQAQAIRTKAHALMFKTLKSDASNNRPGIADQILVFKKPGQNKIPVLPVANGEITNNDWIEWAHPINRIDSETEEEIQIGVYGHWHGIQESDTLQKSAARDEDDVKHICPLQLETIARCIKLYTNPGELVLDPFGGIGSTGYQAVKLARRAVLCELKDSYFAQLVKNLRRAEQETAIANVNLFSAAGVEI